MRVLRSVVTSSTAFVMLLDPKHTGSSAIRPQVVSDQSIGNETVFLQQLAHELQRGMELPDATSASLVAVTAFGLASASSYAWSGLIDWPVAALLVGGGLVGAIAGAKANAVLGRRKGALARFFAWFVMVAGVYVGGRGALAVMQA